MTIKRLDHVSVVVDSVDDTVARLRVTGAELVGEVAQWAGVALRSLERQAQ